MKNLKSLFVDLVTSSANTSTLQAQIKAQKPYSKSVAEKSEIDAAMVRALAHRYSLSYGQAESNAKLSGLAIKSPGKEADEATTKRFGAARKALSMARRLFERPVAHAQASLKDREHAEAKRLAKFTKEQRAKILKLAAMYEAKEEE